MVSFSNDERLALFLTVLGDEAVDLALGQMPGSRPQQIRHLLSDFKKDPPTDDEIEFVLQDFDRYFRFALNSLEDLGATTGKGTAKKKGPADKKGSIASKQQNSGPANTGVDTEPLIFETIKPTDDPVDDLNQLHPFQIATALSADQPKTIAMVLTQIDPTQAAKTLELLNPETRVSTFLVMSQPVTVPRTIIYKVLRSTFEKANSVTQSAPVVDRTEQLVAMLRSMPKTVRGDILAKLREDMPELAELIQIRLYRFEDILRLEDRAVQTVLTKIASDRLVMALTRGDEDITKKILGNMSKRARETIEEEIGFNERAVDKDIEAARADIAQTLAKMDEAGEISL